MKRARVGLVRPQLGALGALVLGGCNTAEPVPAMEEFQTGQTVPGERAPAAPDPSALACGQPGQRCCGGTCCVTDGDLCNGVETCQDGFCVRANPITCPPISDACHFPPTCNPATGSCSSVAKPEGSPCDDANACTTGEVCRTGVCQGGTPQSCEDGNACTIDSCATAGGCFHTNAAAGTACPPDSNPCTSDSCDGAGSCIHPALADGLPCGSGRSCYQGSCCQATYSSCAAACAAQKRCCGFTTRGCGLECDCGQCTAPDRCKYIGPGGGSCQYACF
jgi:hypothetical protein